MRRSRLHRRAFRRDASAESINAEISEIVVPALGIRRYGRQAKPLHCAGEVDLWLLADAPKALKLQRPLPDDALQIVANGEKEGFAPIPTPRRTAAVRKYRS